MSDEKDNQGTDEKPQGDDGPRAGERLAEARRKMELSVADVAKELHLDEYKIRALEQNQFDVLGAPVFAKGHLRKYAQLVRVEIDDVLADYYALDRTTAAPPVVGDVRKPAREIAVGPWLAALGAALAIVIAYWYFVDGSDDAAAPPGRPADARPADSGPAPAAPPATGSQGEAAGPVAAPPEAASEAPGEADGATPVEAAAAAPAEPEAPIRDAVQPPDGELRLVLRFTGECWTEISDATGRRLYYDLGRPGRVVDVSGEPPFAVLLGNVDNVRVEVDGSEYPIALSARRGQTATFTIQAP